LPRVDNLDLNLFDFDYDLTLMYFFLDADGHVYGRYGQRDSDGPDNRQSLAGLKYTMREVLTAHADRTKTFAPTASPRPKYLADLVGRRGKGGGGGCLHCHTVKERIVSAGPGWTLDQLWRFPMPDNVGIELEVDRGDIVKAVRPKSPADAVGLKPGDRIRRVAEVPIHSEADVTYALDRAPKTGTLDVAWVRGGDAQTGTLKLADGWKRGDLSWRPSTQRFVPSARLYGKDLKADERAKLGLSATQLAFRQNEFVPTQAKLAGIQAGDVIIGIGGKRPDMDVIGFVDHVQRTYLIGETIVVSVLRDGRPLDLPMKLLK
jgi:predicted metalloprotease with PDZ domain